MAAFALAASLSPGPVNIVALSAGARYGLLASLRHVAGATVGFTLLLVLVGLGLNELLSRWVYLSQALQLAGGAFLLYMAYQLTCDEGKLQAEQASLPPSVLYGAAMQWLNPKAWLAAMAGPAIFAISEDAMRIWQFAAIYFVVCFASIASWAYAGSFLQDYLNEPKRLRLFNRLMALLLAGCAAYLLAT